MARLKHDVIQATISSAVAAGATFTVDYPDGKSVRDYSGKDHIIHSSSQMPVYADKGQFKVAFGASNMTVTMITTSLAAGEVVFLHLDRSETDPDAISELADEATMSLSELVIIDLGVPATQDADAAVASQAATLASGLGTGINGALASGGVATFDVPRNVVAAWTGTAVLTVTGTDQYGSVLVESSASGTSLTGKKAFKTVTGVSVSANVTGLTVGMGTKLGLPVFLARGIDVLKEIQDDAAPTAGTLVAGDIAGATATTGDVRGTYAPNAVPNG